MKYSIIIPVYNSEKYLEECVKSVTGQTYKDIEVILVDDESSDESPAICQKLAEEDSRIKYIRKKNGGTSAARNTGIDNSTGDYLMFIDNDDLWANDNALWEINSLLEESHADTLMFNTAVLNQKTSEVTWNHERINREEVVDVPADRALKSILEHGLMAVAVWSRVFKRKVIEENHVRFPDGMRNEDTAFSAGAMLYSKSYDWYDGVFYHYRVNTGDSQTSEPINKKQLDDLREILIKYAELGKSLDEPLKKAFYSYLAFPYSVWLGYSMTNRDTTRAEIKSMKKLEYILKYDYDKRVKMLSKVYRLLGYKGVCFLLKMWVKKNR
jgi:glycosyltransferase involved in cell wall biosynthesis